MNKGSTFQTILVGVDGTPEAENAAMVATSLANNLRARMILLGVLAPLNPESQAEGVGLEKAADERLLMEEQLQKMLTAARECGVDVVAEIAEISAAYGAGWKDRPPRRWYEAAPLLCW